MNISQESKKHLWGIYSQKTTKSNLQQTDHKSKKSTIFSSIAAKNSVEFDCSINLQIILQRNLLVFG